MLRRLNVTARYGEVPENDGSGKKVLLDPVLLGLAIFVWSLFGILTREPQSLATFWPANAFLLGMLIRFPLLANRYAWPAAFLGYIAADFLTGGSVQKTVLLALGNLAGVSTGYLLLSRMSEDDRRLRHPQSVLFLALVLTGASAAAGLTGAFINPLLFGGGVLEGFGKWFVGEFVNFIAIVPVILTIPDRLWFATERRKFASPESGLAALMPVGALLASVLISLLVGGPGSLAFPVPALLWCAVSYGLFLTSLLTLAFGAWTLLGLSSGVLAIPLNDKSSLESVRLGVMLVSLAPLMVASIIDARNRLIEQLRYAAAHDGLTGLSNRAAFFELASARLGRRGEAAVLMLDIDHFKVINDSYGHLFGDRVLRAFADCLRRCIRESDIACRMGGEEFAVFLPACGREEAESIAERIRRSFSETRVGVDAKQIRGTVSIGFTLRRGGEDIAAMLAVADRALYLAKENGRNRSEFLEAAPARNSGSVAVT